MARNAIKGQSIRSLKEISESFWEKLSNGGAETIPYFPAGSEAQNGLLQCKGDMFTICAEAGCGKTAFAVQATLEQLRAGLRVSYFCTESSSEDILARFNAAISHVPHYVLRQAGAPKGSVEKMRDANFEMLEKFGDRLFIIGKESGVSTVESIIAEAKRIISTHGGLDVMYVDFVQNVYVSGAIKRQSKYEQMNHIIEELHEFFKKKNIAGIVLSQINRDTQKVLNAPPGLHSIKDSSLIGQLSDETLFLYREKPKDNQSRGKTYLYNAKGRNSPLFKYELQFDGVCYQSSRRFTQADIPA